VFTDLFSHNVYNYQKEARRRGPTVSLKHVLTARDAIHATEMNVRIVASRWSKNLTKQTAGELHIFHIHYPKS
jgi:hypothetical protein